MQPADGKYLQFRCGPYGLLVDLDALVEIAEYQPDWCSDSGSASTHHGKPVRWRERELAFIDLRIGLGLDADTLGEPHHALVLRDSDNEKPRALVAVDSVQNILDIAASRWYHFHGVDPQLDIFFDRLFPAQDGEQLLMCLAPVNTWIGGVTHGN